MSISEYLKVQSFRRTLVPGVGVCIAASEHVIIDPMHKGTFRTDVMENDVMVKTETEDVSCFPYLVIFLYLFIPFTVTKRYKGHAPFILLSWV